MWKTFDFVTDYQQGWIYSDTSFVVKVRAEKGVPHIRTGSCVFDLLHAKAYFRERLAQRIPKA
jgi:hypothetical protein